MDTSFISAGRPCDLLGKDSHWGHGHLSFTQTHLSEIFTTGDSHYTDTKDLSATLTTWALMPFLSLVRLVSCVSFSVYLFKSDITAESRSSASPGNYKHDIPVSQTWTLSMSLLCACVSCAGLSMPESKHHCSVWSVDPEHSFVQCSLLLEGTPEVKWCQAKKTYFDSMHIIWAELD